MYEFAFSKTKGRVSLNLLENLKGRSWFVHTNAQVLAKP